MQKLSVTWYLRLLSDHENNFLIMSLGTRKMGNCRQDPKLCTSRPCFSVQHRSVMWRTPCPTQIIGTYLLSTVFLANMQLAQKKHIFTSCFLATLRQRAAKGHEEFTVFSPKGNSGGEILIRLMKQHSSDIAAS